MWLSLLRREVLDDSLAVNGLLCQETSGGEHGKTTVLELLRDHQVKLSGILGLQAKGIESDVSYSSIAFFIVLQM
jgi:hypothetical protein